MPGSPIHNSEPTTPRDALKTVFGFDTFRPNQAEIINHILSGRDVFAVMATGSGKSLCYQLPAVLREGTAVVISPLISLMKDQVDAARANGIAAAFLNSSLTAAERSDVARELHDRRLTLLYVAPERLAIDGFLGSLDRVPLSLFCVDEAHCISEWGHDFRPDYLKLAGLADRFPGVPVAAFTATATHDVQADIVRRLGLRDAFLFRGSFDRPNLLLEVRQKRKVKEQLIAWLDGHRDESGIVYCRTRKTVESIAAALGERGINAAPYHAGFEDVKRAAVHEAFRRDEIRVIVATIAFGMGIDKPDIRFVLHADLPKNVESYYQEIGRAGRDGDPAYCILFFTPGDIARVRHFVDQTDGAEQRELGLAKLRQMAAYASTNVCRRRQILAYFGQEYEGDNCGGCDICTGSAERADATVDAQKLLSACVRTGQRFGAGYLAEIVTGAETERIRTRGHDQLPTYGVGEDRPQAYWRDLARDLVAQGILAVEGDKYPTLRLTDEGMAVLRGRRKVAILKREPPKPELTAVAAVPDDAADAYDAKLYDRLRDLRTRLAEQAGVPPYVVFSNRALRDMARRRPTNDDELLECHGVGQAKLARYGKAFLGLINGG
jgi:ATP-dependent DNA helicase RecQ